MTGTVTGTEPVVRTVAVAGVLVAVADRPLAPGDLTDHETVVYRGLPSGPRRRAWLTARRALRAALTACALPADTARHPTPGPVVSLSHAAGHGVAAVLATAPAAVRGVGIDLELDRDPEREPLPGTAGYFLTPAELDRAARGDLLRLWTVKEALFKADPANATAALRDYALADPALRHGSALRRTPGASLPFRYASFGLGRGALSVAVSLSHPEEVTLMQNDSFTQLAGRIGELTSTPVDRLTPDVTIRELAPDSFTFIEIAVDLQEEYDVVLSQEDLHDLHTLGDLERLLTERRAARPA